MFIPVFLRQWFKIKGTSGNLADVTAGGKVKVEAELTATNFPDSAVSTKIGEVQISPTTYTLLDRLKAIWTVIRNVTMVGVTPGPDRLMVNVWGSAGYYADVDSTARLKTISRITGDSSGINVDVDSDHQMKVVDDGLSVKIGEVQDVPTTYTVLSRLKAIYTAVTSIYTEITGGLNIRALQSHIDRVQIVQAGGLYTSARGVSLTNMDGDSHYAYCDEDRKIHIIDDTSPLTDFPDSVLSTKVGEVQDIPTTYTILDRLKKLLTGIVLAAGSNVIGAVKVDNYNFVSVSKNFNFTTAQSDVVLWTPATGKSIVLLGLLFSTDTVMNVFFKSEATVIIPKIYLATNGGVALGEGHVLWKGVVNGTLTMTSSANGNHSVLVWGYEE